MTNQRQEVSLLHSTSTTKSVREIGHQHRNASQEHAIDTARIRRAIPSYLGEERRVQCIIVVLCSSRSGSSLFAHVLRQHPEVTALAGEEEPYYVLTRNGFQWTSDHDGFDSTVSRRELVDNILDEILEPDPRERLRKRVLLQFPYLPDDQIPSTPAAIASSALAGHYDGLRNERCRYQRTYRIEEPPFVLPLPYRAPTNVLLFKTPQNAYRIGVLEKLFPTAEVRYIHLTRGFAQTVNGLVDGWECPWGFFSHYIRGRWWKFDLPPGWRSYVDAPLHERCLHQWMSAHLAIMNSGVKRLVVQFERFLEAPQRELDRICRYVGLQRMSLPELPVKMATASPRPMRWVARREVIEDLRQRHSVREAMTRLGYSMNEATWR
jgi:Sulfotransferase family